MLHRNIETVNGEPLTLENSPPSGFASLGE
jgi:hypothetical protein